MVKIIIDEEKCDGCGLCIPSCHEGALAIVNGKAKLVNESLCDGMGACIGECPRGAITFEEEKKKERCCPGMAPAPAFSCPSSRTLTFEPKQKDKGGGFDIEIESELRQWPIQLHLVSPNAPYFKKSNILLAADCTAFAMGNFHAKYLKDHSLMIACPKLDSGHESYIEKLTQVFENGEPESIMVLMMEVPCCSQLLRLVKEAASRSSKKVVIKAAVISLKGDTILEQVVD
jgi:ferredoxin